MIGQERNPLIVTAAGGIGNCINAAFTAQAIGAKLHWMPAGPLSLDMIFENPEEIEITSRPGKVVWTFPNTDPDRLGTKGHFPNHEGMGRHHKKLRRGRSLFGNFPLTLRLKKQASRLPENCIGIHLRTLHPRIRCDVRTMVRRINIMAESGHIFLACDQKISGVSESVLMTKSGSKMKRDNDRSHETTATSLEDWATLGQCSAIFRNSPLSTFADGWCFSEGMKMMKFPG